jgi:hypothetical protein
MPTAINIGLACWVYARTRASGGFLRLAEPIPFESLAKDREYFSRLVSDVPVRSGGTSSQKLWELFSIVLNQCRCAGTNLTVDEETRLAEAKNALFHSDGQLTAGFKLYKTYAATCDDLLQQGKQAIYDQIMAEWLTFGRKAFFDRCIADIILLSGKSSLRQVEEFRRKLQLHFELSPGQRFAESCFSPSHAEDESLWVPAEVSFAELRQNVRSILGFHGEWESFSAAKEGVVKFRYCVAEVLRDWFSPRLFDANDIECEVVVSGGDGSTGLIPAFISRLYLSVVDDVNILARRASPKIGVFKNAVSTNLSVRNEPLKHAGLLNAAASSLSPSTVMPGRVLVKPTYVFKGESWIDKRFSVIADLMLRPGARAEGVVVGFECCEIRRFPNPVPNFKFR